MNKEVKKIYDEVYNLFPLSNLKKHRYVRRDWIFPNHIDVMIKLCEEMCATHKGNLTICYLSTILHDTGLVYGRTSTSSKGHEERSLEYARNILKKHGFNKEIIKQVLDCIKATNPSITPKNLEQKIVRTADALSQLISIHFIAKATFSENIKEYIIWLEKKLNKNLKKICFDKEKILAESIVNYYLNAIKIYREFNK